MRNPIRPPSDSYSAEDVAVVICSLEDSGIRKSSAKKHQQVTLLLLLKAAKLLCFLVEKLLPVFLY